MSTHNLVKTYYAGPVAVHATVIQLEKSTRVVLRQGTLFGRVLESFSVPSADDVPAEIAKRMTALLKATKWVVPLNGTGANADVAHWMPDVRERVIARIEKQVGYRVNIDTQGRIYRISRRGNNPRAIGQTVGRVYDNAGYMVAEITQVVMPDG